MYVYYIVKERVGRVRVIYCMIYAFMSVLTFILILTLLLSLPLTLTLTLSLTLTLIYLNFSITTKHTSILTHTIHKEAPYSN